MQRSSLERNCSHNFQPLEDEEHDEITLNSFLSFFVVPPQIKFPITCSHKIFVPKLGRRIFWYKDEGTSITMSNFFEHSLLYLKPLEVGNFKILEIEIGLRAFQAEYLSFFLREPFTKSPRCFIRISVYLLWFENRYYTCF